MDGKKQTAVGELAYLLSHLDAIGKPDDYVIISNTCGWGDCIKAGDLRELYRLAKLGASVEDMPGGHSLVNHQNA